MSEKIIIFYSGKLWHSDKPFPGNPEITDSSDGFFNSTAFSGEQIGVIGLNRETGDLEIRKDPLKDWLSTAYEVVNPEVIPWTPGGFERCVDGDQITLPEGYGIKKNLQWHPVGCEGKWQNTNEYYFDTVQFPCGKRRAATITLPEKTENSAGLNIGMDSMAIGSKNGEPSESQEEMMLELFQRLYDCLERGHGTLQNIITDFMITRNDRRRKEKVPGSCA